MRAIACARQGTNAWTDRDHTAYNAVTAGPIGLQRLLPVLLDHVLSPTLTDAQFATEVFHVDGDGQAKGVVYCEMQGREATEDDLSDRNLYELLYPGSGYRFECGGLTPDIERISNVDVRKYHKRYYSPSNTLILVHGPMSKELVEEALDEWMKHTDALPPSIHHRQLEQRPWRMMPPPLSASVSRTVEFGAEDEEVGSVSLGWSGPPLGDVVTCTALEVLFRFLREGAASPLAQHFVECASPLASSVDFDLDLRVRTCFTLQFSGVPNGVAGQGEGGDADDEDEDSGGSDEDTDEDDDEDGDMEEEAAEEEKGAAGETVLKEGVIVEQLMQVLRGFVDNGFPEGALDKAINRHWVKTLEECEDEPSDALQNYLLPELIFADHVEAYCAAGGTQRATALNTEPVLNQLRSKDDFFWRQLLAKWVVEAPVAEIVMKPSKALVKSRAAAEKLGVEQRRRALGEEGLRSCKMKLEEALTANAPQPLPTLADGRVVLAPVPPASSIPMLPLKVKCLKMPRTLDLRGGPEQESSSSSSSSSSSPGVTVQLVRTSTMLHTVCVGFDCRRVPAHLRPWFVLMQVFMIQFICFYIHICACVCVCVCVCVCIYTYIYAGTYRHSFLFLQISTHRHFYLLQ